MRKTRSTTYLFYGRGNRIQRIDGPYLSRSCSALLLPLAPVARLRGIALQDAIVTLKEKGEVKV